MIFHLDCVLGPVFWEICCRRLSRAQVARIRQADQDREAVCHGQAGREYEACSIAEALGGILDMYEVQMVL